MRDAVPARDRYLESSPQRSQLPERVIKTGRIHKISDQEAGSKIPDPDQVDAVEQHDQLTHAGEETIYGRKHAIGYTRAYIGRIVDGIGLFETLAKIIAAVECQYDLKIVQRLLDLGTQAAGGL